MDEFGVQPYMFQPELDTGLIRRRADEIHDDDDNHVYELQDDDESADLNANGHQPSPRKTYLTAKPDDLLQENTEWCDCDKCVIWPTMNESFCCFEVPGHAVHLRTGIKCIRNHEDFQGSLSH